jgi:uncharacterized protein (TIGR03382 family)
MERADPRHKEVRGVVIRMAKHMGRLSMIGAGLAVLASAGISHAAMFNWTFTPGQPQPPGGGYEYNSIGGSIHSLTASFDDVSKQLSFTATFSDRVTTGYYMALNNGPMPRSRPGQLGMFYFDAGDVFDGDPSQNRFLTAYGYNGANDGSTWRDGDSVTPGDQAPDLIRGVNDPSWITSITAMNVVLSGGINGRSFSFTVNATSIINHVPLYPDSGGEPWFGTGFGNLIGIWFHPFANQFDATYNAQGGIATWDYGPQGSLDGFNLIVPAPSTVALGALALGGLLRRRRR